MRHVYSRRPASICTQVRVVAYVYTWELNQLDIVTKVHNNFTTCMSAASIHPFANVAGKIEAGFKELLWEGQVVSHVLTTVSGSVVRKVSRSLVRNVIIVHLRNIAATHISWNSCEIRSVISISS